MTKIFKKSLAVVVAAALCLTAFVGCLTVSAAESTGTVTIGTASVTEGTATASVTVNLTSTGFLAMYTNITYPDTLKLTGVTSSNAGLISNFEIAQKQGVTYTEGDLKLIIENNENLNNLTEASYTLTFDTSATAVGDYVLTYVSSDAADASENTVAFTGTNGKLSVTSGHTHDYTMQYSVVDGNCITKKVCSCGDVVTVATIANVAQTQAPIVASSLAIKFRVKQGDATGYSSVYGEFTKDVYSGNTLTGVSEPEIINAVAETVSNTARWTCEYKGIASYEMTTRIHTRIFGTNADGLVVLLSSGDFAFADYLEAKIVAPGFSDAYRTLFADIANYGAASQTYMKYHTDYLANANIPAGHASALPETFVNNINSPSGDVEITAAPVVGNNIKLRLRILKSAVSQYNIDDLKFTVNYIDAFGAAQTFTASADQFTTNGSGATEKWQVEFDSLVAAHLNDSLTIKVWNGTNEIGGLIYGFEAYAAKTYASYNTSTGSTKDLCTLCQAAVAYGRSAATLLS